MSYERERISITNFLQDQRFFGLLNFGLDGDDFKEANNSGYMTIIPGRANIRSVAGPNLLVGVVSVLTITFFMGGGQGSSAVKVLGQTIVDAFFDKKLSEDGIFLDFSANGLVPYISTIRSEAPFIRTVVNAPFVRTELKSRS